MGLDGIELVMSWEESFGISLPDREMAAITTPRQLVDLLTAKLHATADRRPCLTLRAFYRLRQCLIEHRVPRSAIHPKARLKKLLGKDRQDVWSAQDDLRPSRVADRRHLGGGHGLATRLSATS